MRRSFKLNRKKHTISTVVPEYVYNVAIKAVENSEYISLSDYLRGLLLEDLKRRGYLPPAQNATMQGAVPQNPVKSEE
jgi:Arc/MetJ-type ribon-helix-helix transcriptional regulator